MLWKGKKAVIAGIESLKDCCWQNGTSESRESTRSDSGPSRYLALTAGVAAAAAALALIILSA